MSETDPVVLDDDSERTSWRYRCPNGHAQAEPTNDHWWCPSCARQAEQGAPIDPESEAIEETKTREELRREQVEIGGWRWATAKARAPSIFEIDIVNRAAE